MRSKDKSNKIKNNMHVYYNIDFIQSNPLDHNIIVSMPLFCSCAQLLLATLTDNWRICSIDKNLIMHVGAFATDIPMHCTCSQGYVKINIKGARISTCYW